jgi:hypothetical protein
MAISESGPHGRRHAEATSGGCNSEDAKQIQKRVDLIVRCRLVLYLKEQVMFGLNIEFFAHAHMVQTGKNDRIDCGFESDVWPIGHR